MDTTGRCGTSSKHRLSLDPRVLRFLHCPFFDSFSYAIAFLFWPRYIRMPMAYLGLFRSVAPVI